MFALVVVFIIVIVIVVVVNNKSKSSKNETAQGAPRTTPQQPVRAESYPPHIAEAIEGAESEQERFVGEFAYKIIQGSTQFVRENLTETEKFAREYMSLYNSSVNFRGGTWLSYISIVGFTQALLFAPKLGYKSKGIVSADDFPVIFMTEVLASAMLDDELGNSAYEIEKVTRLTDIARDYPPIEAEDDGIPVEETNWYTMVTELESSARKSGWNGVYQDD